VIVAGAGALAVVVGIAAVIVTVVLPGGRQATGYLPSGSSAGQDAQQTASAFLQAWASGDVQQAADYTDRPAAAEAALAAYRKYLHLRKLTASVTSETAVGSGVPRETVTYGASAVVAAPGSASALKGTWSYHGSLVAYQETRSAYWYVAWAADDLAPNLTASAHLAAVQVAPQVVYVTDASGNNLTGYGDAGLSTIAGLLGRRAPAGQGAPGLNVEIQAKNGQVVADSQAAVIAPRNIYNLPTTIEAAAEQAARSAVGMNKDSSMVVIQPSTGKILAIANNSGYNDFALTAAVSPGSTMKTITSTALFDKGIVTADTGVSCPAAYTVQGVTYHNDAHEALPAGTPLSYDYAQSCNNAFDKWWPQLSNGGLAGTARQYYGLDQKWDIGLGESAAYMNVPASASGSELAQELFGEGQITASPLAMASVAATVSNGQFEQPYLVAGTPRVSATALPSSTDSQLKQMMRAVVTEGTAAGMGFGPQVYAKTGTADIVGQEQPNSWFIAFDPAKNVAIACLVLNAGYGAQYAAPEVKTFLDKY
jgi:hypothetical protein